MRLLFPCMLLIMSIVNCNSQSSKLKVMTTKLSDKEIKEQGKKSKKEDLFFMKNGKLDILKLKKEGKSKGVSIPTDNGREYTTTHNYQENFDDGTCVYVSGNNLSGYRKTVRIQNSDFENRYTYYTTGDLKMISNFYTKEFSKGFRFWFNQDGTIKKYENHDAPYKFSWEDVLELLKEQKIKKEYIFEINRSNLSGNYEWAIIFKPEELEKTDSLKTILLDAKTGEIKKEIIWNASRLLD